MITGKHCRYKFLWSRDNSSFEGVGILVAEKWIERTTAVDRNSSQKMSLRLLIGRKILYIISSYAPQSRLSECEKGNFLFSLLSSISVASSAAAAEEMLLRCGYLNGHIWKLRVGLKVYMEGLVNESNGTRVLELCAATDLVITNTYFTKSDS